MKFAIFAAPHNYDVDKAYKGTQMRLKELQWDSVVNKNLVIFQCHVSYLKEHGFPKSIHFACQLCVTFVW